jgi:hypothetical protein
VDKTEKKLKKDLTIRNLLLLTIQTVKGAHKAIHYGIPLCKRAVLRKASLVRNKKRTLSSG